MLAKVGLFPPFFGPGSRLGAKAGLLDHRRVVLVVANFVDLSAIASVGSATSLVHLPARLRRRVQDAGEHGRQRRDDRPARSLVTAVVLVAFAVDTVRNAPETFIAIDRDRRCSRSSSTPSGGRADPAGRPARQPRRRPRRRAHDPAARTNSERRRTGNREVTTTIR